jgi:hypothetical protein
MNWLLKEMIYGTTFAIFYRILYYPNQKKEYDHILFFRKVLTDIGVIIFVMQYYRQIHGGFVVMYTEVLIIAYIFALLEQVFIGFVLLVGRKFLKARERREREKGIYKPPTCLLELCCGVNWRIDIHDFYQRDLTNSFLYIHFLLGYLRKYLFKLQYRAIVKPEQLMPDSSAGTAQRPIQPL